VRTARRSAMIVLSLFVAVVGSGRAAWAHGDMQEPTPTSSSTEMPTGDRPAHLEVQIPQEIQLGTTVTISAILMNEHGHPIQGATITFERPAYWGAEANGHLVIGTAITDENGVATITDQMRTGGDSDVDAIFAGNEKYAMAEASGEYTVVGDSQLYESHAGIRIPWLNLWVLAAVIALVWTLYFVVGLRVLAVLRAGVREERNSPGPGDTTRRRFITEAVPYTAQAALALIGGALIAVVARSPHTHGNLLAPPQTRRFTRSPVARIGDAMKMRAMPDPLDQPVSFANDVLPIFLHHGGPHIVRPTSSPPPGNLMLDSYEHLMSKEGVVVPGKPEKSELLEHLLSVGMQMPPSVPPLPHEVIQVIVTWIAQGALDN